MQQLEIKRNKEAECNKRKTYNIIITIIASNNECLDLVK